MTRTSLDEHAPSDSSYLAQYDPDTPECVSSAVVRAVAAVTGTTPLDLDPIAATIDPDALDAFVCSAVDDAVVRFAYHGLDVTVGGCGEIRVVDGA